MRIWRVGLSILVSLIALTVLGFGLQSAEGEIVVNQSAPAEANLIRVVEAENYTDEVGCEIEGHWKPWEDQAFSGGVLITNEHTETWGIGLPLTFTLEFTGTAVSVVYRQDIGYASLSVGIDDQPEYEIDQGRLVTNQAEICFIAGGPDPHTIVLRGAQDRSVLTDVITIDALKVFDGSEPCGSESGLCGRGIVVPAYFWPDLPDGYWGRLARKSKSDSDQLAVIANVSNGPGVEWNLCYAAATASVQCRGGSVLGYVHTCYGKPDPIHELCPKPIEDIKADVDKWYQFYRVDGIFFDEVSTLTETVAFYQELYDYVESKQPGATVYLNFGTEPPQDYLDIGSSTLCTFEGPFRRFMGWSFPSWLPTERSCALVYDTSRDNLEMVLDKLSRENVGWFYVTSDTMVDDNPWDTLPDYFEDLVNFVDCQYLPVVSRGSP